MHTAYAYISRQQQYRMLECVCARRMSRAWRQRMPGEFIREIIRMADDERQKRQIGEHTYTHTPALHPIRYGAMHFMHEGTKNGKQYGIMMLLKKC